MPFFSNLGPEAQNVLLGKLVSESRVNGFWIAILGEYFPSDPGNGISYLINAEERVNDSRPDLYVTRLDWDENIPPNDVEFTPTLIYEGKGAQAASNWEHIRAQLDGYGEAVTRNMGVRGVYLMGAKGQYVSFWYYKRGELFPIKPMRIARGQVQIRDEAVIHPAYHVGTGFANIHAILEFITNNPDPR